MQLFIQALLVISYVAGTSCQKITFDNTDVGGITVGRFYFDGTIGENVTALVQQNWVPIMFIEVMKINASSFGTLCQFAVSGAACNPYPIDTCQCVYNTTTDNVHFVVNGTAGPDLYNAILRVQWQHENDTIVYSNKNYTVPGPKAVEDTTTSVPIISSEPPKPPKPPTEDNIVLIVCLSVIIPIVVIAIVIGIVWYFKSKSNQSKVDYYNCGYHFAVLSLFDLAVSNNGTDMTAKADENEQPEPDRKHSEHTDHASEESSASPSNVTIKEVKATPNDNLQQHNSDMKDM